MEDFYRPSLIGRGGPIAPTTVPGTDFVLKNHMVRLLRQNCQFHGFRDEDANEHLDNDPILEETETLLSHSDDFVLDYETFCFDIKEKSSGSTTSHSLPEYESFCFNVNQIEEKSSGSTSSHFELSHPFLLEYESFHFDLSIDLLPPADRSDSHHEEFVDELAHITSPPEYDRFYFDIEPDLGELTIIFEENISKDSTNELTSSQLNDFPLLLSDCDSTFSKE
nr:reverse transcriptase domain-containing protein [Tanacetum cinerariifolium]